jgi:hypothetical protein
MQSAAGDRSCDCKHITGEGVTALGHGCGQLQTIFLNDCSRITDIGLSALGRGCNHLLDIYLGGCTGITDIGKSALGLGPDQIRTVSVHTMGLAGFTCTVTGMKREESY